ncbi:MAG TPA: type II toxin-antitoxin system PemK/MazF family toxin [Bryobacteraceae bacterium]|nr:type II toxin-antitoxin system PemK/MazF family toxin [Bryobacteraceae bacterium]
MKRGELYLVRKPGSGDPRKQRVFVVVSRQALVDSRFSTVICAPVYSQHDGLSTQVRVGTAEGLKKESSIHCDELVSLPKSALTHFVGSLKPAELSEVDFALAVSLGLADA